MLCNTKLGRELLKTNNEKGATMIEYALLAALIGIAMIAVLTTLRGNLSTGFSRVGSAVANPG